MTKPLTPLRRKDQATGYAKAVKDIVAWLHSEADSISQETAGLCAMRSTIRNLAEYIPTKFGKTNVAD